MSKITPSANFRCNEQIRINPIRLIDGAGNQIGVIDTREALHMARDQGLDLVEVAPNERPPVCRIMDYGKFKYQQKKNVKKHHEQQLKEVRLRPKTDSHDREIKVQRALKFLAKGDKVQFTMLFRGRERAHREIGFEFFRNVTTLLGELIKVERPPLVDGRQMIMVVSPVKAAIDRAIAAGKIKVGKPGEPEHDEDDDLDETEGGDGPEDATTTDPESPKT